MLPFGVQGNQYLSSLSSHQACKNLIVTACHSNYVLREGDDHIDDGIAREIHKISTIPNHITSAIREACGRSSSTLITRSSIA